MNWVKIKINWISLIWLILTKKHFRHYLKYTIAFAIESSSISRGTFVSDVIIFDGTYLEKLIKPNRRG